MEIRGSWKLLHLFVATEDGGNCCWANSDRGGVPASNHAPDKEHDNCSNHSTNKPGSLVRAIPTEGLTEKGRQERSSDA
jgi:hypothetical protein